MAESPVTHSDVPTEVSSVAIPVSANQPFPANVESFSSSLDSSSYPTPAEAAEFMKSSLHIQPFSDKHFIVLGQSKPYRSYLTQLGGSWKTDLTSHDGSTTRGWIFPLERQDEVKDLIERVNRGEVERDKNTYNKRPYHKQGPPPHFKNKVPPSLPTHNTDRYTRSEYGWYKPRVGQKCNMRVDGNNYVGTITRVYSSPRTGAINRATIDWDGKVSSEITVVYDCAKDKLLWRLKDYQQFHSLKFF